MRKTIRVIIFIVLLACLITGLYKSITIYKGYSDARKIYNDVRDQYFVPADKTDDFEDETAVEEEKLPQVDFEALKETNEQAMGWIYIEDTEINYPIMQAKDNQKYLTTAFNNQYAVSGSIFLDYRCSFHQEEILIWGHNMKDGSMFGDLDKFREEDYIKEHEIVRICTEEDGWIDYRAIEIRDVQVTDDSVFGMPKKDSEEIAETVYLSTCPDNRDYSKRTVLVLEKIGPSEEQADDEDSSEEEKNDTDDNE